MGWGDSPLMSLPLPLPLLFLSTLWAEDKAQVEPLSLPLLGLLDVVEEGVGLMKGPALLRIDCWQTSKAVWIRPNPLSDSIPSFINLAATV